MKRLALLCGLLLVVWVISPGALDLLYMGMQSVTPETRETRALDLIGGGGSVGGETFPGGSTGQVQFNDGGAFSGDAGFTYDKTTDRATVGLLDAGGAVYNVKAYGAKGDGANNDTSAIQTAYAAAGVTGGILYFPPGIYVMGQVSLSQANVTWRGAGMYASVLKSNQTSAMITSSTPTNPTFEDLGFDGAHLATQGLSDNTTRSGTLTVRRCRFTELTNGVLVYTNSFVLDDNTFEGKGDGYFGTGIFLQGPLSHGSITNNKFRYVYNGTLVDTGSGATFATSPVADVDYSGNYHDLGFYTLKERLSNSGATVSYTATVLTDTAASFSGINVNDYVRVMATRRTGTGNINWNQISDAGATFQTAGVLAGEIVRSGGKFGVVVSVESETVLNVEEWLSETDRTNVGAPPNGTYTVYSTVLGKVSGSTGTTVTVGRWMTLNGATATTPAAQTRYEILPNQPNYPLQCETGCTHWKVSNNTFLRAYSDQLSFFGTKSVLADNVIAWGQDMGITVGGVANTVTGNRIDHQGVGGISMFNMNDSTVSQNSITNTTWTTTVATTPGGIIVQGNRNTIMGNTLSIDLTMPQARYGIVLIGLTDQNMLIGNMTRGHGVGGLRLDSAGGATTTNRKLSHLSTNETEASIDTGSAFAAIMSSKLYLPAVGCQGTTGSLLWDTLAANAPTATCSAGATETTLMRGVADFPDTDGPYSLQQTLTLPSDWAGALDGLIKYRTTTTNTGLNTVWQLATVCRADGEVDDAAFNTASTVVDAGKGTANQLNDASIPNITTTGCAPGELLHLKLLRDRTHASDTMTGVVSLVGLELTLRRTQ